MSYDGDLGLFPDETFDVIFTKSVLVVVPELEPFLLAIRNKLKPNGRFVFIENGYGNFIINTLRNVRHRGWDFSKAKFFKKTDMHLFSKLFDVIEIKTTRFPPVFFIYGCKKRTIHSNNRK